VTAATNLRCAIRVTTKNDNPSSVRGGKKKKRKRKNSSFRLNPIGARGEVPLVRFILRRGNAPRSSSPQSCPRRLYPGRGGGSLSFQQEEKAEGKESRFLLRTDKQRIHSGWRKDGGRSLLLLKKKRGKKEFSGQIQKKS